MIRQLSWASSLDVVVGQGQVQQKPSLVSLLPHSRLRSGLERKKEGTSTEELYQHVTVPTTV